MVHKYKLNIKRFYASGSNSGTVYSGTYGTHSSYYYTLSVSFEEQSTSTDNNTSHIKTTATLYGHQIGYGGATNNWWEIIWYDNKNNQQGTQVVSSSITSLTKNTSKSIEAEFDVVHNDDGRLSGYAVVSYHAVGSGYSPKSATVSIGNTVLTDIPRQFSQTPSISLASKTETSATFNWSTSETCNWCRYHLDGSSGWVDVFGGSSTSGSFTVSGLNAGSPHNVYLECRRQDSGQWSNSNTVYFDTHGYPSVSMVTGDFNIGSDITINIYNPLGRQISVDLKQVTTDTVLGSYSGRHNGNLTGFNTATDKLNFYNSIPNAKTGRVYARISCSETGTTNNSGNVQYSVVGADCLPTFSNFQINDSNIDTVALTGSTSANPVFVKGYSIPQVTILAADKATLNSTYPAGSMTSYNINFEGGSKSVNYSSSDITATVDTYKTGDSISVSAVDSRGVASNAVIKTATYKEYAKPYISSASVERDQNGVGENVHLSMSGTWWNASFGSVSNSITDIKYYYKRTSDSTYTAGTGTITFTTSDNTFTISSVTLDGPGEQNEWDIQTAYHIKFVVEDELAGSEEFIVTLPTGSPALAMYKNKLSVGGKYDTTMGKELQVHGDIDITGTYYKNGIPFTGGASGDTVPIGAIMPFPTTTAPTNWLVCDGSAVSRTTYSELFAVIGTTFGAGDGSTTFNLPNSKGRFLVGRDSNDSDFDNIGETGGVKRHQHMYGLVYGGAWSDTIIENDEHAGLISYDQNNNTSLVRGSSSGSYSTSVNNNCDSNNKSATITHYTANATVSMAGNLPPYLVACFVIKAKQSAGLIANIAGAYSTSSTDAYSCSYVNGVQSNLDGRISDIENNSWRYAPVFQDMIYYGHFQYQKDLWKMVDDRYTFSYFPPAKTGYTRWYRMRALKNDNISSGNGLTVYFSYNDRQIFWGFDGTWGSGGDEHGGWVDSHEWYSHDQLNGGWVDINVIIPNTSTGGSTGYLKQLWIDCYQVPNGVNPNNA